MELIVYIHRRSRMPFSFTYSTRLKDQWEDAFSSQSRGHDDKASAETSVNTFRAIKLMLMNRGMMSTETGLRWDG